MNSAMDNLLLFVKAASLMAWAFCTVLAAVFAIRSALLGAALMSVSAAALVGAAALSILDVPFGAWTAFFAAGALSSASVVSYTIRWNTCKRYKKDIERIIREAPREAEHTQRLRRTAAVA